MKKLRTYQKRVLKNIIDNFDHFENVMAMCPNAGKTFTCIKLLENLIESKKVKKVLVLAHGTIVLRSQFYKSLKENRPKFTFSEYTGDKLRKSQVVVSLPQSLKDVDLKSFDYIVVDEAHERYLSKESNDIVKRVNPKGVVLLTGTPSKFIKYNNECKKNIKRFKIHLVAMSDVPRDYMSKVEVFVCNSSYDISKKDYNQTSEVRGGYKFKLSSTEKTIENILVKIGDSIKKEKTMFICKRQDQAKQVNKYLNKKGIKSIISCSDLDKDSKRIDLFVKDDTINTLVVVARGILGFNFPRLTNIVDLSATRNIDRMYQMFSRITRTHDDIKIKRYYKVSPKDEVETTEYITAAMLSLIHRDNMSVYGKITQKELPLFLRNVNTKVSSGSTTKQRSSTIKPFENLDIIAEFIKLHGGSNEVDFKLYSKTTLSDCLNRKVNISCEDSEEGSQVHFKELCREGSFEGNWAKDLIERVREEEKKRIKTSLYMDKDVYKRFKKVCSSKGASTSKVLELLMRDFSDDVILDVDK